MIEPETQQPAQDETLRIVEGIFRKVLREDRLSIRSETSAKDVDGWDSFTHMTLIVAIEKRFGIKFKLAELQAARDVGDLLNLIKSKVSK